MAGRTFVRGVESTDYSLAEFRANQLQASRVRGPEVVVDDGIVGFTHARRRTPVRWRIGPGDDPFLTQTLQVSFHELPPHTSNKGHGHQNEAAFYILQGRGYEIHDGQRHDWEAGDLVVVHTDSVHRHFNESDEPALALVVKAKSLWMFLGLVQQGKIGGYEEQAGFGPPVDWSDLWTPGVESRVKVVKQDHREWSWTPDGRVRVITSPETTDVRLFSVDLYEQEVAPGSRTARHWHMADEVLYVIAGHGYSLQWEVQADIQDRYRARIREHPDRFDFAAGDVIYVPQNTVHQHFNASEDEPLLLLSAQNRIFKHLGYDNTAVLDPAPEPQT